MGFEKPPNADLVNALDRLSLGANFADAQRNCMAESYPGHPHVDTERAQLVPFIASVPMPGVSPTATSSRQTGAPICNSAAYSRSDHGMLTGKRIRLTPLLVFCCPLSCEEVVDRAERTHACGSFPCPFRGVGTNRGGREEYVGLRFDAPAGIGLVRHLFSGATFESTRHASGESLVLDKPAPHSQHSSILQLDLIRNLLAQLLQFLPRHVPQEVWGFDPRRGHRAKVCRSPVRAEFYAGRGRSTTMPGTVCR